MNGKLGATLFAPFTKAFDRVTGEATLDLAAFSPTVRIAAPAGTTHFKVVMGASELDFENEISTFENDETTISPYTAADTAAIALTATITANSTLPVVQVLGVEFYQEVNGQMYSLKNGTYNALSVTIIDKPQVWSYYFKELILKRVLMVLSFVLINSFVIRLSCPGKITNELFLAFLKEHIKLSQDFQNASSII